MIATKDIAWLAGLLEGEGCFTQGTTPTITVAMTDRDVVDRAACLLGAKRVRERKTYKAHHKPSFGFVVTGRNAIAWMMTLYPLMGARRRQRIEQIITWWKQAPGPGGHNHSEEQRRRSAELTRQRHAALTPEERAERARRMAKARWAKHFARHNNQSVAPPTAARGL